YERKSDKLQNAELKTTTTIDIHNNQVPAEDDIVITTISSNTGNYKESNRRLSKEKSLTRSKVKKDTPFNGKKQLDKILSLRQVDAKSNKLEFRCKLRGVKRPTWVSNKIVNELYPTDVIHFYQQLLKFDVRGKSE
ncbi:unnamed protein product, partial [Didymodactylos carnosus]